MRDKLIQKSIVILNFFVAIISIPLAIEFFGSKNNLGKILSAILVTLALGQIFLQKSTDKKKKIIFTIASVIIFLVVIEIAFQNRI